MRRFNLSADSEYELVYVEDGGSSRTPLDPTETLLRYWMDIAESVLRSGFRKIVVLNSHGGQPQLVEILVRELRVRHGALAVSASTYGFGLPDGSLESGL